MSLLVIGGFAAGAFANSSAFAKSPASRKSKAPTKAAPKAPGATTSKSTAPNTAPVPKAASKPAESPEIRAKRLLNHVDDLWRGKTSRAKMTMHVKTKHYDRTLQLEAWSKGKEKSLVRILAPRREKGTSTLKSGKQIYTWLPRTARVIRLSSAMMGSAWMGSHFSNDDLVKESRMAEDYTFSITAETTRGGKKIVEITMKPKPNAAVVWGKVILEVDATNELPVVQRYFDEDGKLARTMTFLDVKTFAGRKLPARMRMTPTDRPTEFTEMRYEELALNLDLPDSFFSVSRLKRGK